MGNRLVGIAMTIGLAILTMVSSVECAWAEKRIALAIGNSNYQSVPKLPNPSRDAIAIGQMFRNAGFDSVDVIVNTNIQELKRALRKFASDVDQADVAVIYYAGHGLEISGVNYIIPIDAKLASDVDAEDEAVRLDRVISSADGASKLRVIILDACRDNPFPSLMRRTKANHPVSSGLGKTEPTSTDTLIAYAAKAGSVANDGDGEHSPFTSAILKNLTIPGLDIRLAFGRVKDEVMRLTGSRQEPFVYGSLGGSNFPLVPAPRVQASSESEIRGDYELVARVGTRRAWEVFLNTHRTGFYADLAREQMAALPEQDQASNSVTRSKGGTTLGSGAKSSPGNAVLANLPQQPSGGRDSSSQETIEWNKIKGSSDPAVFENFIERFPNAPLAINAQKKLDVLKQAQREREAAQKAAEEARVQAEQKKAAEAAAKNREEEERRAKAIEAEQKARAAEAERKAAAERQKAEEAARERAAAEAAAARAAAEKQVKEAEEARRKTERDAKETACRNEQSRLDQIVDKGSAGSGIDDLKSFASTSTCGRLSSQISAATDKFKAEQAKREREAAQKAAEEARIEAEKKKAEAVAAKKREDDERRVREAEAVEKAKAAAAELAAAKKREEDKRRANALEAEQQAKAAEEKRKAEQAEQQRLAAEVAARRAAAEKQAREEQRRAEQAEAEQKARAAEAERLAADAKREAAGEATCNTELAKLKEIVARGSDGSGMDDLNAFAKAVTCDKLGAQIVTALDYFKKEVAARAAAERQKAEEAARERAAAETAAARAAAEKQVKEAEEARRKAERDAKETACRNEQSRLDQIVAKGSAGAGMDELKAFGASSKCERLSAEIAAATDKFKAEQAEAERKKAEAVAAKRREDDERRAREAEAAEKAKAAAAELAAEKKREEDERRAKALEAEQRARAAEEKRKAEQAEQERAAAAAALARAEALQKAKEDERRAKQAEAEQRAKVAEAERLAAEEKQKAEQAAKIAVCQAEQSKLEQILANGSQDSGIDNLNALARSATCEGLGAQIIGALEKFKAEAAQRAATMPNSLQLILAAQTQLIRLGCELPGKPDGTLNDATKSALVRFMTIKGRATNDLTVTTSLVDDLTKQTDRVCPLECNANEVAKRGKCIAIEKPPVASRRKDEEEETRARKKQPEKRQADREPPRKPAAAETQIRARVQAIARPTGGGGGGGGSAVVGVGF